MNQGAQQMQDQIAAPVAKAASALGAGVVTSAMSMSQKAQSFFPTDFGGWAAAIASVLAAIYSLCLLWEWWTKKVWRPLLKRYGL